MKNLFKFFLILLAFATPVEAKRVLITKGYSGAAYTFNINSTNTAQIRTAISGGTNGIVAFMGDSTMRGVDETALPYNSQYPNSMPMRLAVALTNTGIPATAQNWYGLSGTSLNDYVIRDSRITVGGTTAMGSAAVQGGSGMSMSSATATMTFTPHGNANKADIYTLDSPSFIGATLGVTSDSLNTTIIQTGNNTIRKTTVSLGASAQHTIRIERVSGANSLYGIDAYDDTITPKQLFIRQWGASGATASQMIDNTGAPSAGRIQQYQTYPPHLVFCECGVINSWRNGTAATTVKTQITTLVQSLKASNIDVILLTPPYDNGSAGNTANQDQYIQAMYQIAAEQGVGLVDLRQRWISYNYAVSKGWMDANDAVHPKLAGYQDEAVNVIYNVVKSILNNTFAN